MTKYKYYIGIDISKDVFDIVTSDGLHKRYPNKQIGFQDFLKDIPKKSLVVMESTGYYHHQLAQFLVKKRIKTSVVNPLSVKRFRQMRLLKIKTDKADAAIICDYAQNNEIQLYKLKSQLEVECRQLTALADLYQRQRTALKNKLQAELEIGSPSMPAIRSIKRQLRALLTEILLIEKELSEKVQKLYPGQTELLMGIPGIGPKTSNSLLLLMDGFKDFDQAKKVCSYAGITPTIRTSGSSVRGRSYVSKMGNPKIRNLLFLCSFSAVKFNSSCRALFERIVAKGKSKKLALVAVSNKLLRQAYAVIKNNIPYSPNYNQPIVQPEMPAHCL
ncbi:MAG: IS110 family transposase [Flavobacterium sp.]